VPRPLFGFLWGTCQFPVNFGALCEAAHITAPSHPAPSVLSGSSANVAA
jgi:hypothetical protein